MDENLKNCIGNQIRGKVDKNEVDHEVDHLLNLAKKQGYIKENCTLPGQLVMALVNSGENPCDGCNISTCKK